MKTIDTLVEDIYALFDGHECNQALSQEFGKELSSVISTRLKHSGSTGNSTLRMSNIGRPCDRSLYYDVNSRKVREPLLPHTKLKFLLGDIVESVLLYLAKEAGHSVTEEQASCEINGIVGHIDAIIDGAVIDVKSASSYAFKKFQDGTLPDQDSFGYIGQISGYKHAFKTDRAGFLAMDKQNGTLALYEPPKDALLPVEDRIDHIKAVVDSEDPPDRWFAPVPDGKSGNEKLCVECSYCAHKQECWPELRTFVYAGGRPVYLTKVVKEPRVNEIVINNIGGDDE